MNAVATNLIKQNTQATLKTNVINNVTAAKSGSGSVGKRKIVQ